MMVLRRKTANEEKQNTALCCDQTVNWLGKNNAVKTLLPFVWLACLFLFAGCTLAYKEEGAIDYRKAEVYQDNSQGETKNADNKNKGKGSHNKALLDQPAIKTTNAQGETIYISKLERKNVSTTDTFLFKEGDKMCIRLLSAYIKNYTEGPLSWAMDAVLEGQIWPRGEIAVVVNVKPMKKKGAFSFDFSEAGIESGKIVFYSDDVVAGQFLNFNNMPIYGPSSAGVDGIGIEIWIMELDVSDAITGNLLNAIASHGTTPYIGSANTLLKSFGKTLLDSSRTHDTNFLYRMLLEPKKGNKLKNPALEVGNYVLIRVQGIGVRSDDINWSELAFDENSGRLYKWVNDDWHEYKDLNYLVISIDKDKTGRDITIDNKSYKEFVEILEEERQQALGPFISTAVP